MRFLLKTRIPVEAGNALIRDPNFGNKMKEILSDIKPEAAYFAFDGGQRTIYFVVNVASAHELPALAEPLWLSLKADVEFIPAMNQEEFARAAASIERAAKKY